MGSAGGAVSLPIFHGGAISGRYRGARATFDEAVADYDRAVLNAYRQVADAATSRHKLAERLAAAHAALAASEDAHALARKRYEGGLSSYLDVLAVEDRLLQARMVANTMLAAGRSADVALIRALGGGFADPATQSKDAPNE
jgi:outer membrane protein TolC